MKLILNTLWEHFCSFCYCLLYIFDWILLLPSPLSGLHGLLEGCRRLQRHAAYLLQALLGPGAAGTPSPVPNPNAASLVGDVKASALAKAWAGITAEDGDPAFQTTQMRFLAAAARYDLLHSPTGFLGCRP